LTTTPSTFGALPDDEQRLEVLSSYCVLDTEADPDFDDIAAAAAAFCRTPVALISFVDRDRQWFKAAIGTDITQTPLSQSVCAHVVTLRAPLVIRDLREDPRTENNPLVLNEPHLRFYGGYPLVAPSGEVLGSLCVIDFEPHPDGLSDAEMNGLGSLARQTMRLLSLRRDQRRSVERLHEQKRVAAMADLRADATEKELQMLSDRHAVQLTAGAAGGIGTFELDFLSNSLSFSPELYRIFGLPQGFPVHFESWEKLVHPDDISLLPGLQSLLDGTAQLKLQYRIIRPSDGAVRWIRRQASFECDPAQHVNRMIGTIQDITQEKDVNTQVAALLTLGDRLRDAGDRPTAMRTACELIGTVLNAQRVGLARIDRAQSSYTVEYVWCSEGTPSIEGTYSFDDFPSTSRFLQQGAIFTLSEIRSTPWLRSESEAYLSVQVEAQILVPIMIDDCLAGSFFVHSAQPRNWTQDEVAFVQAATDRISVALAMLDVAARRETINLEILHRLKNTLALVKGLAYQSLRNLEDQPAVKAFTARLIALGSAHDMLTQKNWTSADFRGLASDIFECLGIGDRVQMHGGTLSIGPDSATSMAMMLHELSTNAIKYGSLSDPSGEVHLDWAVEDTDLGPTATINWIETGGPTVIKPERQGFGSRLLTNGLGRGSQMQLTYAPDGLRATLCISLDALSEN